MKFKKVLAGFTAAALAVGSLSLISFAADEDVTDRELSTGSLGAAELVENQWDPGKVLNPSVTLDNKWGSPAPVKGYSAVEIEYTCDAVDEIANLYLVAQNGTMPNDWFQKQAAAEASGKITLDLSTVQDKTYECLLVQVQPAATYAIGDTFDPKFTVTSAKLIADKSAEDSGDESSDDSSKPEENEPGEVTAPTDFIDSTGKAAIGVGEDGVSFSHYTWDLAEFLDEGKTIADIKKVKVVFSDESVATMKNGAGGGLSLTTKDVEWLQKSWCNGCGEKESHDYQLDEETKSVTYIVADDVVIEEIAKINMQKWWGSLVDVVKLEILDNTDAVIGTIENEEGDEPDDPVVPDSITATVKFYTQGNEAGGWAWVDNGGTEYTITSDSDAVELKWEPIAVDPQVADADSFGQGGLQISLGGELALVGTKLNVEITDIMLDGNAIDDVVGEYTVVANWDSTAAEIMILVDFINYETVGKNLSAKVKVTTVSAENPGDTSSSGDTSEPEESKPVIVDNGGNFVTPGGSTSDKPADTTAADESKPAETAGDTSAENKPVDTAKPADDTTDNGDDSSSAPSQAPDAAEGTQAPAAGNTNGDSNANNADKNQNTGIVLAFIPAIAAAAGVVISKKRK